MILRPDHQERHQIWIWYHMSRCPDSPAADVGSSPDKGGGGCEGGDGAASKWPVVFCIDHLSLLSTERRGTAMY